MEAEADETVAPADEPSAEEQPIALLALVVEAEPVDEVAADIVSGTPEVEEVTAEFEVGHADVEVDHSVDVDALPLDQTASDQDDDPDQDEAETHWALDPVDERLDREVLFDDGAELAELYSESMSEHMHVDEPLDGPVDEAEWIYAMEYPATEDIEAFGEEPTLPIEAEAVELMQELDAADDTFAEPRLGLASLLPGDESDEATPEVSLSAPEAQTEEAVDEVTDDPFLEAVSDTGETESDEDWDESGTPMPWEDVGGFWGGDGADWGASSEDAFWNAEETQENAV